MMTARVITPIHACVGLRSRRIGVMTLAVIMLFRIRPLSRVHSRQTFEPYSHALQQQCSLPSLHSSDREVPSLQPRIVPMEHVYAMSLALHQPIDPDQLYSDGRRAISSAAYHQ